MQAALCASCGGALDLAAESGGRVKCEFCGTWTLFQGSDRAKTIALGKLGRKDDAELVDMVRTWVGKRALGEASGFAAESAEVVYAMREVRVERGSPQEVLFLGERPWYAKYGNHRVGRKVAGEGPAKLVLAVDEPRAPWPGPPPEGIAAAFANFEREMELEVRQAGHSPFYALFFEGEPEVVAADVVTVRFTLKVPKPDEFIALTDDHTYFVKVAGWDGKVLERRVPRRKLKFPMWPIYLLVGLVVLGVVGFVLLALAWVGLMVFAMVVGMVV
ncbi:MAG: hypothetical protein H6737_06080 [Alphaproteobacteria bacterium]|nr:hypothetical protein [Alphaproteobacteria bacterium]